PPYADADWIRLRPGARRATLLAHRVIVRVDGGRARVEAAGPNVAAVLAGRGGRVWTVGVGRPAAAVAPVRATVAGGIAGPCGGHRTAARAVRIDGSLV